MTHFIRLQLVGRITYYLGWIGLLCGGLAHLNIARSMFKAMTLTTRNLFEISVVCFLICVASELRALEVVELRALKVAKKELPSGVKRQAVA
jgi:hypothetical protein